MNHFEFFEIPLQFYPDQTSITKKFKQNTIANHPDLNDGSSDSEEITAQNNEAFKTLKNDKKRIRYILDLVQNSTDQKQALDPMFLMEMMELNESLMEVKTEEREISKALEKVKRQDQQIWIEIETIGKQYDSKKLSLEEAGRQVNALYLQSNYLKRILENHSKE